MSKTINLILSNPDGLDGFITDKLWYAQKHKEDKLLNLSSGYLDKSQTKATQILDSTREFIEQIGTTTLTNSIDAIYKQLGINQNTMALVNNITNTLSGNITKVQTIINIFPRSLTHTPSAKGALMEIAVSYKDILMEQINSLKLVYDETVNAAINSLSTILQLLHGSIEVIIRTVEELFDQYAYKYTGHHVMELYFMLQPGIALVKAIIKYKKELKKDKKEKKEKVKKEISEKIDKKIEGYETKVNNKINENVKDVFDNTIGNTYSLDVGIDLNDLYNQLYEWLSKQSDALYNAFMMLLMKDFVSEIKEDIQKLTNIDIRLMADNINTFDDLIQLLDSLGLNEHTPTIDFQQLIATGMNSVFAISNSFKTIFKELDVPTVGQLTGSVIHSIDVTPSKQKAYEIDTELKGNDNIIKIKLHADPSNKIIKAQFITLFKLVKYNNKRVFNKGQINTIIDNIIAIYNQYIKEHEKDNIKDYDIVKDTNSILLGHKKFNNDLYKDSDYINKSTFIINAIVEDMPRIYTFQVEVDNPNNLASVNTIVKYKSKDEILADTDDLYKRFNITGNSNDGNKDNGVVDMLIKSITNEEEQHIYTTAEKRRNTFDIVKQMLMALKPMMKLLKEISKLIENYKTNKQTVQTHARKDLVLSFKNVMRKLGLSKDKSFEGKNIYTVRTKKLYDYCLSTLQIKINKGFSEISSALTNKLIEHLISENKIVTTLQKSIPTVLYFDIENIENINTIAKDGTINGLDTIEIIQDEKTILYSENNKSTTSSQILRAMRKKVPFK